nr:zinc finger, CCHC-type [Tanacetum cinerariifolium]
MGEADVILGIKIKRKNKGIVITQSHYIEKILKKFNREDCSSVSTPMDPVEKLKPNTGKHVDQLEYSRAIGCLMYDMTSTRPDIAYAVGRLSRFTSNPSRHHWHAITRVFKYLKGTMNYGLSYVGYPSVLEVYLDASWINHVEDSSFISGWVFLLGGGVISWASKKQTCITGSTMESEFVALVVAGKSRQLGVRHSMIRELIRNGVISIEFVWSQHNLADHFTKGLAKDLMINSVTGMLSDPKRKTFGEKDIDCIFVGHVERFKAYRFYAIEPNDSDSINLIIESRDAIFDENHFSSIPRPKDIIPNLVESQRDDHSDDVPNETLEPRKDCSSVSTPMDPVEKLKPNTGKHMDQLEYSRAIGCLMYAMTSTRPDIAYAVGRLSRFTKVYLDASWINHVEDSSSISGWVFLLGGGVISWASKKQTCITGSTMEYEFVALVVVDPCLSFHITFAMSTQQDIYAASSENRPPMLNKENYVPWSSRLLRYAKSRPNGKLIHNSIIYGPYVRRMIPEPGDTNREVPVNNTFHVLTDDELTEKELKQIEADQAIQTILLSLPKDIYAAVDSYETTHEIWFTSNDGESIESYYHRFLKLMNDLKRNKHFPEKIATPHQDQPSFNQNYMQQPMPNLEDITDLTTAMNMALALMAKVFKLNNSTPTNNNQRILSNPRNRQIAQPGMNMGLDRQMQMVGGNGENQFRQYAGQNNVGNHNGLIGVLGNANHNENGNLVAARAEGNAAGHNGNQIWCYNCRGVGRFARNCTVRPKRMDATYLQTQLLIAHKEEAGIQLQAEEFDLMAAVADLDEIKEVNANCILMTNLQQASTSGTQTDKAPVYDSDGSAKKNPKLFNEWERFTSNEEESIESYYHCFLKLMNDLKRNKHFPENIA